MDEDDFCCFFVARRVVPGFRDVMYRHAIDINIALESFQVDSGQRMFHSRSRGSAGSFMLLSIREKPVCVCGASQVSSVVHRGVEPFWNFFPVERREREPAFQDFRETVSATETFDWVQS